MVMAEGYGKIAKCLQVCEMPLARCHRAVANFGESCGMKYMPTYFRAVVRLARVGLHLIAGILIVLFEYPHCGDKLRLRLKQQWARDLLALLDIELQVHGQPTGALRVANHVSWLDIFVIDAIVPSTFVAKDEVRKWPVVGWLSSRTGTIFIRRNLRRAAHTVTQAVAARLEDSVDLAVFPEATSSDGSHVLPFHPALLQGAIRANRAVQPLALRYQTADGRRTTIPAYHGDISLPVSLWRIASACGSNRLSVRVSMMPVRAPHNHDRRSLAKLLHADITSALAGMEQRRESSWQSVPLEVQEPAAAILAADTAPGG